jgi:hypothetical protein
LLFAIPKLATPLVENPLDAREFDEASQALRNGFPHYPYSLATCHATSSGNITVHTITGNALKNYFGRDVDSPFTPVLEFEFSLPEIGFASHGRADLAILCRSQKTMLAVIEFNDSAYSVCEQFGQAAAEASNGLFAQCGLGLGWEDCIVPFIVPMAGYISLAVQHFSRKLS